LPPITFSEGSTKSDKSDLQTTEVQEVSRTPREAVDTAAVNMNLDVDTVANNPFAAAISGASSTDFPVIEAIVGDEDDADESKLETSVEIEVGGLDHGVLTASLDDFDRREFSTMDSEAFARALVLTGNEQSVALAAGGSGTSAPSAVSAGISSGAGILFDLPGIRREATSANRANRVATAAVADAVSSDELIEHDESDLMLSALDTSVEADALETSADFESDTAMEASFIRFVKSCIYKQLFYMRLLVLTNSLSLPLP
jgi:hypothetical protein